ncbi:MAG: diacylglycerol kinase family protein [Alphaproteobacteria bacterium]
MTEPMRLAERIDAGATPRRILIIRNPTAGRPAARARFQRVLERLSEQGCRITERITEARGDAERFAREADRAEHDVIAVAGGDGTLNEVVNGLGPEAPPLAVIPLGTVNLFAREIGLARETDAIVETILNGAPHTIRLGAVNGRRFLMVAGIGFDAHVVRGVGPRIKRALGVVAYALRFLLELFRFRFPRYAVEADGVRFSVASAVISKGRYYAGPFVLAPRAGLAKPAFDLCLFRAGGVVAALSYALALGLGRLARHPSVSQLDAKEVRIDGPAGEPIQLDGDTPPGLTLPARVTLAVQPLEVLMPA